MGRIISGVTSISSAIRRILDYEREEDEAHLLCAKAVLRGAMTYEETPLPYRRGSVQARRAEGLLIEQSLRRAARALRTEGDPRRVGAHLASRAVLDERFKREQRGQGESHPTTSILLPPLMEYLSPLSPEYRVGLITFGERLDQKLDRQSLGTHVEPLDVDLDKLDKRRVDLRIRRVYREFNKIVQIAYELR
ncbi:hypothetical protein D6789_03075 [Candidatus Woesearchaeota archaeon]|nr:MAG: hypothetical protein D6789_03075 [Candidatus Woesearchaeota archaeon]